jgi:hypothetical protein
LRQLTEFIKEKNRTASLRFKIIFPFLALGGLAATAVLAFVTVLVLTAWWGQPVPVFGFEQTFDQPIAFPHTRHAGTAVMPTVDGTQQLAALGLDCTFCHRTVTSQASAGVPPVQQCLFCHQAIGPQSSPELQKLRAAAGLDGAVKAPVDWRRVHRLPDHVRFVHEAHIRYLTANPTAIRNVPSQNQAGVQAAIQSGGGVTASMVCSTCHGDVAAMDKVKQVEPLKMGQCVNCHRDNNAPTDCAVCHH